MTNHNPAAAIRGSNASGIARIRTAPVATRQRPDNSTNNRSERLAGRQAEYLIDDTCNAFRLGATALQQIAVEFGIRERQNFVERGFFVLVRARVALFEIAQQQLVEFAHAASALPAQSGLFAQYFLSASIFLVSAIALAGFRFFGQVCVQFMIV